MGKIKVRPWSHKYAKQLMKHRLEDSRKYRDDMFGRQWHINEATVYNTNGILEGASRYTGAINIEDLASFLDSDDNEKTLGVNYTFKYYRFIHAQMSANPPSVVVRPASSDSEDRRKADAADRLVRHAIREYKLQDTFDEATSKTLLYGTGWIKTIFDGTKGDIIDFDQKSGEIEMEGDLCISSPSTWDIWVDPKAQSWDEVQYVIERKWMTEDEVYTFFPDKADRILKDNESIEPPHSDNRYYDRLGLRMHEKLLPIFCYWEKGMPINGMVGRYIEFLEDGTLLQDDPNKQNPFQFAQTPVEEETRESVVEKAEESEEERGPMVARFPFHLLTDIDVADQVYGKSFVEYETRIQDILNRLDSLTLDNVQAHGVARLVLPEGTQVADDSLTDTPYEVIRLTGNQPPHFVGAPSLMPEVNQLRDRLQAGAEDMAGVNESMFGQQSREQSGFSMQYATNQGNMIRRRLFNKYVQFTENVYKSYLNLVRKHWTIARTVQILGDEKTFESYEIKGADIDRGFDLVVEFGQSLSLDPITRREEIMSLMPVFEKYGVDGHTILSMLKLNELEGLYDINDMGARRQEEIFQAMIEANGRVYIEPREMQEHDSMLAFAYKFIMGSEFRDLEPDLQVMIERHIKECEELRAGGLAAPGMQEANAGNNPPGPAGEAGPLVPPGPMGLEGGGEPALVQQPPVPLPEPAAPVL